MRPHLYLDLNLNLNLNLCFNLDLFLFQKPFQKLSEASFDSSIGFKQPQLKGLAYRAVGRQMLAGGQSLGRPLHGRIVVRALPDRHIWIVDNRRLRRACALTQHAHRYPLPVTAPKDSGYLIPVEHLDQAIVEIRGKRVILSHDLAAAYGVSAKRLNEQVKRNIERFPDDFMFQLTPDEKAEVVANCDHLALLKFSPSLPYAFTEHGAVMAASVLNSKRAVEVSVFVVRAFVRMSRMLTSHRQLALKLAELESRVTVHDKDIQSLLAAIRSLITPPAPPRRKIGFATDPDDNIIAHDRPARRNRKP